MQSILKIALPVLLAGTITTACQTVQTTHGGAYSSRTATTEPSSCGSTRM